MKEKLNRFIANIAGSFDNGNGGYSAKKLSAFAILLCVIIAHGKWIMKGDFSQLEMVLTIDFSFIATLFGITSYDKRNNNKPDASTKPEQL